MAKDMCQKRKERQENKKNETCEDKKTNINWYYDCVEFYIETTLEQREEIEKYVKLQHEDKALNI